MVPYQRWVRCHILLYCPILNFDEANCLYHLDVTTTQRPIDKQGIYSSVVYCIRSCIIFRFCIIGKCTLILLLCSFISVQFSYTWSKSPNLTSAKVYKVYTVFFRIVAAATINFRLAGVRLLIEGGSYLRMAFIYLGGIRLRRSGGILLWWTSFSGLLFE